MSIKTRITSIIGASLVLTVALCLMLLSACGEDSKGDAKAGEAKSTSAFAVKVALVTQGDINETLNLVGNVLPKRKAVITSKVPGKVVKIYFRDGERVKKNAVLVKIDSEDVDRGVKQARAALATAYAAASQAQVQRDTLQLNLDRMKELFNREAISKDELERIEAGFKASEESVKMAEAGVQQAKAMLGDASSYKRDTMLKAPFDGEIAKLLLEEGERIQTMPPTPIMVLMDYDTVEVECQVTEREVGIISEGQPVTVSLDAFPNSTIEATVTRVVPVLDASTRTFTMRINLPNADHRIKPGMMARVKIQLTYKNVVSVPRDAVSLNNVTGESRIVEVVDSKAVERPALIGRAFGNRVEIVDLKGLNIGAKVIISGASSIFTGMAVTITASEAAP